MDELLPSNTGRKNRVVPGLWYLFGSVLAVIEESCAVLARRLNHGITESQNHRITEC